MFGFTSELDAVFQYSPAFALNILVIGCGSRGLHIVEDGADFTFPFFFDAEQLIALETIGLGLNPVGAVTCAHLNEFQNIALIPEINKIRRNGRSMATEFHVCGNFHVGGFMQRRFMVIGCFGFLRFSMGMHLLHRMSLCIFLEGNPDVFGTKTLCNKFQFIYNALADEVEILIHRNINAILIGACQKIPWEAVG